MIEIAIEGELDLSNAAQLRDALFDAVEQDGAGVWIDFERCSFIDSTGLRVIVEGARRISGDYARLGITNLNAAAEAALRADDDEPLRAPALRLKRHICRSSVTTRSAS